MFIVADLVSLKDVFSSVSPTLEYKTRFLTWDPLHVHDYGNTNITIITMYLLFTDSAMPLNTS